MTLLKKILIFSLITFTSSNIFAQIDVDINLNVKHTVGGISEFDRSKFIVIHANQTEKEWDGDNFTSDLRDNFLNGYDVYLGRDTGGITWQLNNMSEDPDRAGFAKPSEIESKVKFYISTNTKLEKTPQLLVNYILFGLVKGKKKLKKVGS